MLRRIAFFLAALALLIPAAAQAAPEIGKPAPDFSATDINGKSVKLSDLRGHIVVLEWTNPECPFVRKHYGSGNMQKLQSYAHDKGVTWISVNSSAPGREGNLTAAQAKDFSSKNSSVVAHYIIDADGKIGHLYTAKTTPHMFVIDKQGNLAYMGALDDKPTPDKADIASATNYVKAAIDSLNAGTPISVTSTQSYGCSVKYAD